VYFALLFFVATFSMLLATLVRFQVLFISITGFDVTTSVWSLNLLQGFQ
jgi:hypothetical protein